MKSKKLRDPRPFLGHQMTRADVRVLASLVGYTANLVGLSKRKIKSEDQLWEVVDRIYGMRPEPDETFVQALRRITGQIKAKSKFERKLARKAAGVSGGNKKKRAGKDKAIGETATAAERAAFYRSWDWRRLRMEVIKKYDRRCMCCGATREDVALDGSPVRLVVDHIKPLSRHWELRLSPGNLQILCDECNMGKGSWDETDHRSDDERLAFEESANVTVLYPDASRRASKARFAEAAQ